MRQIWMRKFGIRSAGTFVILLTGVLATNLFASTEVSDSSSSGADGGYFGMSSAKLISPTGKYGSSGTGGWKQDWSNAFFTCLNKLEPGLDSNGGGGSGLVEAMAEGHFGDFGRGKNMCSDGALGVSETKLAALKMFQELCKPEAYNCNRPDAVNKQSTDSKRGPDGWAIGLFQIGANDAKIHHCTTPSGKSITDKNQLKDGAANTCCALKIAEDTFKRKHGSSLRQTMHAFWQPFGKDYPKIASGINKVCNAMSNNSIHSCFTQNEINLAKTSGGGAGSAGGSDDSGGSESTASSNQ
jgi:hypothetical protein